MHTSIGHQCCDQLTAVNTWYPLIRITWLYRGLRFWPIKVKCFLKLSADKLQVFKWSQAQVWFFFKFKWNMFCFCAAQLKSWFKTDLGRENSANYYRQRRQLLLTLLTMVAHWSRSTSNFYALVGQNLSGELMRKIYAASWILFTLRAEADRVLCQLVMFQLSFFTWCTKWNSAAIRSFLLFTASWFLVEKLIHQLSKSEIRFYTCQLSRLRRESYACGLKTSISRRLTLAGQFLTPDWKKWVVAVLLDTISKNMLTQTHVRNENHV